MFGPAAAASVVVTTDQPIPSPSLSLGMKTVLKASSATVEKENAAP